MRKSYLRWRGVGDRVDALWIHLNREGGGDGGGDDELLTVVFLMLGTGVVSGVDSFVLCFWSQ